MRRYIFPLVLGIVGTAILLGLGSWQVQRLQWKQGMFNAVEMRLQADPVRVPADANEMRDNYLHILTTGRLLGEEIHVLTSRKFEGPGYLIVSQFKSDGRVILVDLGFVLEARKTEERPLGEVEITGNLLWPNEVDKNFTPEPDIEKNIWFARDLPAMAQHLSAEPVLIVASAVRPMPDNMPDPQQVAANIPNDHLEYAITWFSLALVWMGMTVYLLWRIRQKTL
ncbi:MAG: SURF1 family protein [Rhodobacteraceae bacterium]|nr:SURF1 family protein [Paracoccaceae bacterium]